jgi:hypothetical protein
MSFNQCGTERGAQDTLRNLSSPDDARTPDTLKQHPAHLTPQALFVGSD